MSVQLTGHKELDERDRCGNCIGFSGDPLNSGYCYRTVDDKYINDHYDYRDQVSSDDGCSHYKRIGTSK